MVSIIMPVKNEAMRLQRRLEEIFGQQYPLHRIEVLIVDGMSSDATRHVAAEAIERSGDGTRPLNPRVRLLDNLKGQRASALNIGLRTACGEVIVRIDARTSVPSDYLAKCVDMLQRSGADNVGGVVKPLPGNIGQTAVGLAMSHPFGVGNARFRLGHGRPGPIESLYPGCFKREVFARVGLFDEEAPIISEDSDFNYRIRRIGGLVFFDPDIIVYYEPRDSVRGLWRLYFRYGGARAGYVLKHRRIDAVRQLIPPGFVAGLILLLLVLPFVSAAKLLFLAGMAAYVVADVVVSTGLAWDHRRWALLPYLLVAFPSMHLSWGAGFLYRITQRPRAGQYWRH